MPNLTVADALHLAINALRDVAESRKMPSGVVLDGATAELHADAAVVLEADSGASIDAANHRTAGEAGQVLYERLQALMPNDYPDARADLAPTYRNAFSAAALGTERT
ncbi:hypothetical protein BGV71_12290 [Burkholderia ubonensis]|uniref:hypothetical protein n=1 Tax=Burkholderia ubonensis TaxID=101571 RepID=UPI00075A8573|nr:hypothetical protein [Burkholderia ubonensis]KVC79505.1 hypothetical protein WI76_00585 [Burkholderia ubonensis]KVZ12410.1 hypothetical protein WL13_00960 [Burkholderia ubonensis]KWB26315.1 hypothetical protein WL33_28935 [Burkholderia ubonensis]KWC26652.1 hypothetical protein WL50_07445 [Burkholderia ubonensis]OJA84524.1 hypothetical protein BGV71_12290 [Burkholderia ubonensis]